MAKREQNKYEDPVYRTFRLYGPQIRKAYEELKKGNTDFGRMEYPKGNSVDVKISEDGITGISFKNAKVLEEKVRELTGDSKAKLMRNFQEEWQRARRGFVATAILGVAGGIFFLSSNITGNAIADLTTKTTSFLGAGLLIVGLVAGFFWLKNKKN